MKSRAVQVLERSPAAHCSCPTPWSCINAVEVRAQSHTVLTANRDKVFNVIQDIVQIGDIAISQEAWAEVDSNHTAFFLQGL